MNQLRIQNLLPYKECCSCKLCWNICPKKAISMEIDNYGSYKPVINDDKCNKCKKCVNKCPIINIPLDNNPDPLCYAAICSDDSIRGECSSGGVFGELSKQCIKDGGVVYGSSFKNSLNLVCTRAETLEELKPLFRSKYVMSDPRDIYKKVETDLRKNRKVIFCSTPCQIAAMKNYLNKTYSNLLLIDILCHGAPNQTFLKKHIHEKYGDDVKEIIFRDKTIKSWDLTFTIVYSDGRKEDHQNDEYIKVFSDNSSLSECCYDCIFNKLPRQGDITLGDFWGYSKNSNDGKGISAVLVNNKKGALWLETSKTTFKVFEKEDINYALKFNSVIKKSHQKPPHADRLKKEFFKYNLKKAIETIEKDYYDVGLTVYSSNNYGNNITNYSLFNTIKKMNKSVLVITRGKFVSLFDNNPFSEKEISKYNLDEVNSHCERFILGSDQTLAGWCIGNDFFTCMPWVNNDKYIAAFGASIGLERFIASRDYIDKVRFFLARFEHISLREQSGVDEIKKTFQLDADYVLDPVFLTEAEEYRNLSYVGRKRIPKNNFVGAYILDMDEEKKKLIQQIADSYGIKEILMIQDAAIKKDPLGIPTIDNATIEEFLSLIDNSKVFITDSYHGSCLSIILNKNFYVTKINKNRGIGRLENLLTPLGLKNRWITGNYTKQDDINYSEINRKIDDDRSKSVQYLSMLVNENKKVITKERIDAWYPLIQRVETRLTILEKKHTIYKEMIDQQIGLDLEELFECKSIAQYMEKIRGKYTILYSVCDEASVWWKTFNNYLPTPLDFRESFVAIDYKGNLEFKKEKRKTKIIKKIGNRIVSIESEGYTNENEKGKSTFIIGDKRIIIKNRGLNIALYDSDHDLILDLLSIDLHVDPSGVVKRNNNWFIE